VASEGQVVDLFSYAQLTREDEASAREDAALIKAHLRTAAESIITIGLALARQKERLGHGNFLRWIEAEFSMSERSAQRFMLRSERWSKSANLAGLSTEVSSSVLDEITDPGTPESIRDRVEELLVDGQKVTVADIRRMKAEAKQAEAQTAALASSNQELALRVREAEAAPEVPDDVLAGIRSEAEREADERANKRVAELANANVKLRKQLEGLRGQRVTLADAPAAPASNVTVLAPIDHGLVDDPVDHLIGDDDGIPTIEAFAGAINSCRGMKVDTKAFWSRFKRDSGHGEATYEALLDVNAICGSLIKEYVKK
jgi:hypothetical protein